MNYGLLRERMVTDQLMSRGIRDPRVLGAFSKVPRHLFVPPQERERAYADHPLAIGEGQTISQPYIVALMTEHLDLEADSKVLEIGAGSGYQTAILAQLCPRVYSIERIASLAQSAQQLLRSLGYSNVQIRVGDGTLGWPEEHPFDRILVSAAAEQAPAPLLDQLAEGGRLVIPIGSPLAQTLAVVERLKGKFQTRQVCGCVFVPLIGAHGWHEGEVRAEEI